MNFFLILSNIQIALSAIWANRVRSFLTILGIIIGVFSVISIISLGSGLKDQVTSQIGSLGSDVLWLIRGNFDDNSLLPTTPGAAGSFKRDDIKNLLKENSEVIESAGGLHHLAGTLTFNGKDQATSIHITDPDALNIISLNVLYGEYFNENETKNFDRVVIIGDKVARNLFNNEQRAVGKTIKINGKEFIVKGVAKNETIGTDGHDHGYASYIPYTVGESILKESNIGTIAVKLKAGVDVEDGKNEVERLFKNIRGEKDFSIITQDALLKVINNVASTITKILTGIAAVSLLVGGIGVMNIMLVSVTERTKEIGVRKAMGATDRQIMLQFLVEAVTISSVGGVFGVILAAIASYIITYYFNFQTFINLYTVMLAFGFSALVGIIFGVAPAIKAAKKDPIESLRYE